MLEGLRAESRERRAEVIPARSLLALCTPHSALHSKSRTTRIRTVTFRVRAGDAASNTLVPSMESAWWESNPRPASYKDAALTAVLNRL